MPEQSRHVKEDKISLRELIHRGQGLIFYLLGKWRLTVVSVFVGGLLGYMYTLKKPVYTAETTFAMEESSSLGQLSSLTSMMGGLNLGPLGGDSESLFQGENILELYKSKRMVIEALLTEVDHEGRRERLIYPFARELNWDRKWETKSYLQGLSFDVPREKFTHRHDSILLEMVERLNEKVIVVEKPSRRLNIISVKVNFTDAWFARAFNNELVKRVNDFYFYSKTKKSAETVATLQHQADSIKKEIGGSMLGIASTLDQSPNMNALYRSRTVPVQQQQIDLQTSFAAYTEIIKNLELSKLSHLDRQPLIQIIDSPLEYLENNGWRWYKGVVFGAALAGVLVVVVFMLYYTIREILSQEERIEKG